LKYAPIFGGGWDLYYHGNGIWYSNKFHDSSYPKIDGMPTGEFNVNDYKVFKLLKNRFLMKCLTLFILKYLFYFPLTGKNRSSCTYLRIYNGWISKLVLIITLNSNVKYLNFWFSSSIFLYYYLTIAL
jgi:hypothetical protein